MRTFIVTRIFTSIAVLGFLQSPQIQAVPLPADKPTTWEYGELVYRPVGRFSDAAQPAPMQLPAVRWVTSEAEVAAKDWMEMAENLKAPAPKKEATTATHKLRVFDRLGSDGWELVGQTNSSTTGGPTTWTFKRRVP